MIAKEPNRFGDFLNYEVHGGNLFEIEPSHPVVLDPNLYYDGVVDRASPHRIALLVDFLVLVADDLPGHVNAHAEEVSLVGIVGLNADATLCLKAFVEEINAVGIGKARGGEAHFN